jgi:hypothetical protein
VKLLREKEAVEIVGAIDTDPGCCRNRRMW